MKHVLITGGAGYTLYRDADHWGMWQRAYANPELYAWMLAQSRLSCLGA